MKLLVDENIPLMSVFELRKRGYDVLDIRGSALEGIPDDKLWEIAQNEGRVLITTDKYFAQYKGLPHNGILIVRLKQPNKLKIHKSIFIELDKLINSKWQDVVVTVRDKTIVIST